MDTHHKFDKLKSQAYGAKTYDVNSHMKISKKYSKISIYMCMLALLCYFMVLRELPQNDDITGNYINFFLSFAVPPEPDQPIEMSNTSFWLLSEAKIVSMFYITFILASLVSIITGIIAFIKNEPTRNQSGSIAISTLLVIYSYHFSWVFRWY